MATTIDLTSLEADPRLFLYTSLTAGSSHIITATSRMETILKANKIPFQAIDIATDEKARRLWQRRAAKRKLPGLVKEGYVIGDLDEVEEWNEFGELKENIGPVPANNAAPPGGQTGISTAPPLPVNPTATSGSASISQPPSSAASKGPTSGVDEAKIRPLHGTEESASKGPSDEPSTTSVIDESPKPETMESAPVDKEESISAAKQALKAQHPSIDHLSAPASRIHSGSATPAQQAEPVTMSKTSGGAEKDEGEGEELADGEGKKEAGGVAEFREAKDEKTASTGVQALQLGSEEGTRTQEQSAVEGGDAGQSVED
ncbi:hypothetical protein LTR74_000211 [Friedmanniomyces endolithicus]|nr:hypothetical protein LTR74_000211 [Friedmanniomyces endolithicus]